MKRRAFTLIELLVVIGIIALLVSILVPSLTQVRNLAKVVICGSNQHTVGMGVNVYVSDNNMKEPFYTVSANHSPPFWFSIDPGYISQGMYGDPSYFLTTDPGKSTRTDGPTKNYIVDGRPMMCPLSNYSYKDNYCRYGKYPNSPAVDGNSYQDTLRWGTYIWLYPHFKFDYDPKTPLTGANPASKDVLMLDFNWFCIFDNKRPAYWHYNALLLDGSSRNLGGLNRPVWDWLWDASQQPADPRYEIDYNWDAPTTHKLPDDIP